MIKDMQVIEARKVMRDAFEQDPEFKQGYIANVAVLLLDEIPYSATRNELAEKILDRIFEESK